MIYCKVDASSCAENTVAAADGMDVESSDNKDNSAVSSGGNTKRIIDKDGSIKLVHAEGPSQNTDKGFRKGQLALRDMVSCSLFSHSSICIYAVLCKLLMQYTIKFII